MRFFISYSRNNKKEVKILVDLLRHQGHEVWWDGDIPRIADWWATILNEIENCQIMLFVVSQSSVQSEYCKAEHQYARQRNRPIFPFIMDGDATVQVGSPVAYVIPNWVIPLRNQWYVYDDNPIVLFKEVETTCATIRLEDYRDNPHVARPPEPNTGADTLARRFQEAIKLAKQGHFQQARDRLSLIGSNDRHTWGNRTDEWVQCLTLYEAVYELADDESTRRYARADWATYREKFLDLAFDPFNLASLLDHPTPSKPVVKTPSMPTQPTPKPVVKTDDLDPSSRGIYQLTPKPVVTSTPSKPVVKTPPPPPVDPLAQKLALARQFTGKHNTDWTPIIVPLGEIIAGAKLPKMEMCLVPVGSFMMGSNDGDSDEKPVHSQTIDKPYWMARYPVTNAQWRVAVEAKAVKVPRDVEWYNAPKMEDCPVVCVTWHQSLAFAEWVGCTLPSELETEYAARGLDNLIYPWGNDWEDGKRAVWDKNSGGKPNPVTSKPEGVSWVGAMHLSGNVWGWQRSAYEAYPYNPDDGREDISIGNSRKVLRGGSFSNSQNLARSVSRHFFNPYDGYRNFGFRVCCCPHLLRL